MHGVRIHAREEEFGSEAEGEKKVKKLAEMAKMR